MKDTNFKALKKKGRIERFDSVDSIRSHVFYEPSAPFLQFNLAPASMNYFTIFLCSKIGVSEPKHYTDKFSSKVLWRDKSYAKNLAP